MAEKTYWLGELVGNKRVGGIKVDGKLYAIGEPFPTDKVDKKAMAGFKKSGCVGSVPFQVADSVSEDAKDKDIALLQGRVNELTEKGVVDGDRIAELELDLEAAISSGGDVDALKIRVAELEPEVTRLTGENTDLKTDNEEKAALVEKHAKQLKKFKKELKK